MPSCYAFRAADDRVRDLEGRQDSSGEGGFARSGDSVEDEGRRTWDIRLAVTSADPRPILQSEAHTEEGRKLANLHHTAGPCCAQRATDFDRMRGHVPMTKYRLFGLYVISDHILTAPFLIRLQSFGWESC